MSDSEQVQDDVSVPPEGLPVLSENSAGKDLKRPIPVFIGPKRVLGEVYRMERYGQIGADGLPIQGPGNGETVYLCRRTEPGWKQSTGTYLKRDLMVRR